MRGFIATTLGILLVCAGALGFGWFLIFESNLEKGIASMILAVILPIMLYLWHDNPINAYKAAFKSTIMPEIAHLMGGLKFNPKHGISPNVIQKTGLFPRFDSYHSEDCFLGRYKGMKLMFSEAHIRSRKEGLSLFRGVLVFVQVPNNTFKGHTIITADEGMVERSVKKRWRKLQAINLPEDSEYKGFFHIFSDHPETANALLTPELLKELAEAGEIFEKAPISATFFGNKYIFLAIPSVRDMFEASHIHVPIPTREHGMNFKHEIEQILEVIDILEPYQKQPSKSS